MAGLPDSDKDAVNKAFARAMALCGLRNSDALGWSFSSLVDEIRVKAKYLLALINKVHMLADTDISSLSSLAGGSTQSQANSRANALKASLLAHMAEVGTDLVDGAHLAADTTNGDTLAAVADASSLATCVTLVSALKDGINAHLTQTGVHFHDDSTTALSLTTDPPVVLADCIADLNDLLTYIKAHYARASV